MMFPADRQHTFFRAHLDAGATVKRPTRGLPRVFTAVMVATGVVLAAGGCGGGGGSSRPTKTSKPINVACVKEKASSAGGHVVQKEDTVAATGARQYVIVDWSDNRVVVSSWPSGTVAQQAARQYEQIKARLGKLTAHVVVEQHGSTVARWETSPTPEQLKLLTECS
jgi:hypothetical protein